MEIKVRIVSLFAEVLLVSENDIETDIEVAALGVDSILGAQLSSLLNRAFELAITPTDIYECITIDGIVTRVRELLSVRESKALLLLENPDSEKSQTIIADETIVVVGMAGQFAGCGDLEAFWVTIEQGKTCLSTTYRWQNPNQETYSGGFIENYADFDASFFKISPHEAKCIDPQHRLLLQTVQHAIDDSYLAIEELQELQCGVFAASLPGDYKFVLAGHPNVAFSPDSFLGNAASALSGRISYFYDFNGPSLTLDTACSSSLVALNEACLNIQAGHCQAAIVGAVSVFSTPELFQFAQRSNMASKQGRCATFGEEADGFIPAEGCASIVVIRYGDARSRGLRVYGAVTAIGINHDGKSNGLMAPNAKSQGKLIRELYQRSGITPDKVAYVETHGTGTHLGDPIEIRGLTEAFEQIEEDYECYLGAVKPLIGHTLVCSGLTGIIKVLLSFKHEIIPPFPAISSANRLIDFGGFKMSSKPLPWPTDKPFCAVSAFGFAGTNGHVILQKIPFIPAAQLQTPYTATALPFCLSAHNRNSLIKSVLQYQQWIEGIEEGNLHGLSQLMLRRPRYSLHCIIVATGKAALEQKLEQLARDLASGAEIDDSISNMSAEISSLVSLWLSGEYAKLRLTLTKVELICPVLSVPDYPFDAKRYWVDEEPDIVVDIPRDKTEGRELEAVLNELKVSLSELLGFSLEDLRGNILIEDLGLDSLSALRLLAPYSKKGVKIQPHDIFKYKSLVDLADAITSAGKSDASSSQLIPSQAPQVSTNVKDIPKKMAELHSVLTIQWLSYGQGDDVVILAPPLNTCAEAWVQQINVLTQSGRRVIIPIYPGHKNSVFVAQGFSLENIADQFASFIEHELQSACVDLVGWSLGGCLSCLVAIGYPKLVRSLILISTAASFNEDIFGNTLALQDELKGHQDILEIIFDGSEDIVASLGAGTPMKILHYYYEALQHFNIEAQLQNIVASTLLVHGKNDCVVNDASFLRLAAIPQATQLMYEKHGHFIPLTSSRLFNTALIRFLDCTHS
ncbi:MAG: alpha/beta fold hydrolase [Yersinia sp. (in: enterobacteria)]